jgi:hypothetical protein
MGVVFQMPTLVYFLAKMKLVTARFLAQQFKYAVLLIFIISAVITPTGDPVTQCVFAAPMLGLYLLGIVIAWIVGKDPKPADWAYVLPVFAGIYAMAGVCWLGFNPDRPILPDQSLDSSGRDDVKPGSDFESQE